MADRDIQVEDSDLSAVVSTEIRHAQTFDQYKRTLALQYMRGEMPDIPARANGSSQTDRTVADNISWTLPGVVRVFAASDQMVQFEATQEGGEQGAEEASEYTNYSFFRENDGYRILYNATYDSLLFGNGAACSYWCPEQSTTKLFKDKTEEELAYLLTEEGWQGTGSVPKPGTPRLVTVDDPMTGVPVEVELPTFTVRLQIVTERGQIRDMTLKPENLLLSTSATTIEDARFVGYLHDNKTRSDLMEMADEYGWDKADIEDLPAYTLRSENGVGEARKADYASINDASPVKSGDFIDLYEIYIRADKDGDGIAELLQVWYAGNAGSGKVLSSDEWEDDVPFTDIPCYPVPHRWEAEGMFDRSVDIQRVKTVLLRQGLDNLYSVNMPMREVEAGTVANPDILVNPKFNGIIWRTSGKAAQPIIPHVIPYIADKAFAGMEYLDTINTKRTGISKATMALDPEALQNQTATASQLQHDAGYSQIELIARNQAELGWTKFFAKRRNLAKKYIKQAIKIPSRNGDVQEGQEGDSTSKYRTIQPERWSDDMACTINVGLGTGSRDRDMSMLNLILNGQIGMADRLGAGGFTAKALEFLPKIRKTAVEMAESSGLKNPDDYYPEITDEELAAMIDAANQPQPNPKIEEIRVEGEIQAQITAKEAEIKANGEVIKNQAELDADLQTAEAERQSKIDVENIKQQNENARFFAKLQQDRELALAQMAQTEVEEDDGKGGKKKTVKSKADVNTDRLAELVSQQGQLLASIAQSLNAETQIVRGPDGRAVGTRKVVN